MARIFVGDVQGCMHELEVLLGRLGVDPGRDRLYFVGDLINRGPESANVLRLVRDLGGLSVRGNHEENALARGLFDDVVREPERFRRCRDLVTAPDRLELGAWIRSQPFVRDLDDVLLVHAAVPPSLLAARRFHEPGPDERRFVVSARYCDAEGNCPASSWPPPPPPFAPWHHFYEGRWTVVFGHWARQGLLLAPRLRGLDTGCVYGGKLTAWIAEEDRVVQVDARRAYYP